MHQSLKSTLKFRDNVRKNWDVIRIFWWCIKDSYFQSLTFKTHVWFGFSKNMTLNTRKTFPDFQSKLNFQSHVFYFKAKGHNTQCLPYNLCTLRIHSSKHTHASINHKATNHFHYISIQQFFIFLLIFPHLSIDAT